MNRTYPDSIRELRKALRKKEPEAIETLKEIFEKHRNRLTDQELARLIHEGKLENKMVKQWEEEYAHEFREKFVPLWLAMMLFSSKKLETAFFNFQFQNNKGVKQWLDKRIKALSRHVSVKQKKAVDLYIRWIKKNQISITMGVALLRAAIGLTVPQTKANINYFSTAMNNIKENKPQMEQRAREAAAFERTKKYTKKQYKTRTEGFSRTELAAAFNVGAYLAVKQAQKEGHIGTMMKVVSTAGDGHVCRGCQDIDGMEVEIDEYFHTQWGNFLYPPFHNRCRCTADYVEKERQKR